MNPSLVIANLATMEQMARKSGDEGMQTFLLEAQDCVLRLQQANLELRRENQTLRRIKESEARSQGRPSTNLPTAPPLIFQAFAARPARSFREVAENVVRAATKLAQAV
jgi:hypothetical protein